MTIPRLVPSLASMRTFPPGGTGKFGSGQPDGNCEEPDEEPAVVSVLDSSVLDAPPDGATGVVVEGDGWLVGGSVWAQAATASTTVPASTAVRNGGIISALQSEVGCRPTVDAHIPANVPDPGSGVASAPPYHARVRPQVRPTAPETVLDHVAAVGDVVVPIANGEPVALLDVLEAHPERFEQVRIHQMHALHDRPYLHGKLRPALNHVSYFLSPVTRPAYHEGGLDFVPANFSEVPAVMRHHAEVGTVLAAASPIDRHGYFSLGTSADYTASFIGRVPFFLEVNAQMPRTWGRNQVHVSQVAGYTEVDRPLVGIEPPPSSDVDRTIAAFVAERIRNGSTLQVGIGGIPNAILAMLTDHEHLGVHTELLSDGVVDLIENGAVTGVEKTVNRGKVVGTFVLGTRRVYDFVNDNAAVELWPVERVNDPREIGRERRFVSINATLEVDLFGQCASETLGGRYWSGSGGQADFARGAMYSPEGQGFVVLPSTARGGTISRVVSQLGPGQVVTTLKNTVDHVVTEYGVASLRGRSLRERAKALIAIAHPDHRDRLRHEASSLGFG
jgi:acyl-CoA hydrolase